MRTLYIDCGMGAAGDMLTAALLELLPDRAAFLHRLNSLGIPGVRFEAESAKTCGITGTRMRVTVAGQEEGEACHSHHHHGSMADIRSIVSGLAVPNLVKLDILAVYEAIAEAESHVHGVPVEQIHFHEVGQLDAIADITAVCLLLHELKVERVVASQVHVGAGTVRCAHGILPVPAPATAYILRGVPIYGGAIKSELCTPTGAALLKHFAEEFGDMPAMKVEAIGYGMGKKEFPRANCVRVLLGQAAPVQAGEQVLELKCNLDDMTAEAMAFAMERLMEAGALDVFTTPIGMKKSRPGVLLTVLCRPEQAQQMLTLVFRHTTTLGVRQTLCQRAVLQRQTVAVETPYGVIRQKHARGYGVHRCKYEYEDLAKAAAAAGMTLAQLQAALEDLDT